MADLESTYVRIGPRFSVSCSGFWWFGTVLGGRRGVGEHLMNEMNRAHQAQPGTSIG